jgi:hypothetical protein
VLAAERPTGEPQPSRAVGERSPVASASPSASRSVPRASIGVRRGVSPRRVDQRARLLDARAAGGERLDGRAQPLVRPHAFEQAGGAARDADRARAAEPLGEHGLLGDQVARPFVIAEPLGGEPA